MPTTAETAATTGVQVKAAVLPTEGDANNNDSYDSMASNNMWTQARAVAPAAEATPTTIK
jgi:hypothetical protein